MTVLDKEYSRSRTPLSQLGNLVEIDLFQYTPRRNRGHSRLFKASCDLVYDYLESQSEAHQEYQDGSGGCSWDVCPID